jgi:30S ribosomal protein S31
MADSADCDDQTSLPALNARPHTNQEQHMGKGDRKTAKGKRNISSYGNSRSHVATKATGTATAAVVKKAATKAPAKKAVAKKTVAKA